MDFESLTPEGRMQKIGSHVAAGYRVPADWVRWLIESGSPTTGQAHSVAPTAAFADVDDSGKMAKILGNLENGDYVPAAWTDWLLARTVDEETPTPHPGRMPTP